MLSFNSDSELDSYVDSRIQAATHLDKEKTNVNSEPVYLGKLMLLSDQDATALKHHILSSAVISTVFVSVISFISNPDIPLLVRCLLMGGTLTGLQAILVATSNLGISAFELWSRAGKPVPTAKVCIVCIGRFCLVIGRVSLRLVVRAAKATWNGYVQAHTVTLANGVTVWVDVYGTVVLEASECDSEVLQ